MAYDGVYLVRFEGNDPAASLNFDEPGNNGIVVLLRGGVYGGDSGYSYIGTYAPEADCFTADVRVVNHNPNFQSVFGLVDTRVKLTMAPIQDGESAGTMTTADGAGPIFGVRLKILEVLA